MNIEEQIEQNVPLAPFNTFKIGGPAKYFVQADNTEEIIESIKWAKNNGHKYFILAGGSNVLISDQGFSGLIIKNCSKSFFREKTADGELIRCGSGLPMSRLVLGASNHSLTGMEWAVGLPGTVGGAIRGNASCFGSEMSELIVEVNAYDPDKDIIIKLTKEQCGFAYRHSFFKENNLVVIDCLVNLKTGHNSKIRERMEEVIKLRTEKQPKYPSAGSIFKNIDLHDVKDAELLDEAKREGVFTGAGPSGLSAGWLIEKLYFKGKQVGGAMISLEHANFIINKNFHATASDVMMLMSLIKQKVRVEFGVQLKEEIQYLDY
ncbi:MAG: UDP-N-acetylenolpyruvoylglucosamine reductase [Parcubacteria group bacterium GW2011_GWE2_39_37]|nr:MAG: UDP-N-acetylenolpyruvoylglucosamine reductase [Parcubacteria group bacterium GW2011_GWE2_39_37]